MSAQPSAFPRSDVYGYLVGGLTKRELFAAMVMQGLAADPSCTGEASAYAGVAVKWADALLAELAKDGAA